MAGEPDSVARIYALVYDELHQMAHRQLRRGHPAQSFNTTALVHEAFLRLADADEITRRQRAYFFGAAARAMRQILVEAARRRAQLKRGAGQQPATLDEDRTAGQMFADDLIALDLCMDQLVEAFPRQARVVECRFFGGLSIEETAAALELSRRTVIRDWELARAWLYRRLGDSTRLVGDAGNDG